MMTTTLFGY